MLCFAAAPDLLRCALVVWRIIKRWAVSQGWTRFVRWALLSRRARPTGWRSLLCLPVWVVTVRRAVVLVGMILHVQPVVSRTVVIQLSVFTVTIVPVITQGWATTLDYYHMTKPKYCPVYSCEQCCFKLLLVILPVLSVSVPAVLSIVVSVSVVFAIAERQVGSFSGLSCCWLPMGLCAVPLLTGAAVMISTWRRISVWAVAVPAAVVLMRVVL